MRRATTATLVALVVSFSLPATGFAINCEQARKYASTGRSAEDIADTMIADVGEVKKCLAEKGGAAPPGDGAAGTAAPKPTPGDQGSN